MTSRWDKIFENEADWEQWKSVGNLQYVISVEDYNRIKAEGNRMQKKLQAVEKAMMDGMEVLFPP